MLLVFLVYGLYKCLQVYLSFIAHRSSFLNFINAADAVYHPPKPHTITSSKIREPKWVIPLF